MYLPLPQYNGKGNGNGQGLSNGGFVQYPPPQGLPQNHQYQQMMFRNQQQMPPQYHGGAPGIQHLLHAQLMQQQQLRYPGPGGGQPGVPGGPGQQVVPGPGQPTEQELHSLQQYQQQQQQQQQQAVNQANQQAARAAAAAAAGVPGVLGGSPQVIKPLVVSGAPDVRVTTDKGEEGADGKRKRGRPKKLILDPTTNSYINSLHPNFKQLNKLLKNSSQNQRSRQVQMGVNGNRLAATEDAIAKLTEKPTYLRTLEDEAVQQLMQKKDRRGRPRKFPVEQTGITIKGIRVNGTLKQRKKKEDEVYQAQIGRIAKRERGRPKKVQQDDLSELNLTLNQGLNQSISQDLNSNINQNLNFN